MEFKKLEKQLLATAKAFRAFKTEFGYGKSGEELLKPFFRSLEESLGAVETEFDFLIGKDTVNIDGKSFGAYAEAGDTIIFDVSVKFNGRWSDVCRTFFVGEIKSDKIVGMVVSAPRLSLKTRRNTCRHRSTFTSQLKPPRRANARRGGFVFCPA